MVCAKGVPRVTKTLGKANSRFNPTQTGSGIAHHVEAAVHQCSVMLVAQRIVEM